MCPGNDEGNDQEKAVGAAVKSEHFLLRVKEAGREQSGE